MKTLLLAVITFFSIQSYLSAQVIEYQKYIYEDYKVSGSDLQLTKEGNYLFSGIKRGEDETTEADFYFTVTDQDGAQLFSKSYGDSLKNFILTSRVLSNGNFLFLGFTSDYASNPNVNCTGLLTNSNGDSLRMFHFGQDVHKVITNSIETLDGNVLCLGEANLTMVRDFYLAKLDTNGNVLWEKTYSHPGEEAPINLVQLPNGDIIIAGWTKNADYSGYVIKVNADGDILWDRTYTFNDNFIFNDILLTPDGYLLLGGLARGFINDDFGYPVLTKMDTDGNILWQKSYTDMNNQSWGSSIIQTSHNEIFLMNSSYRNGDGELWLMKVDSNGNENYRFFFGDESNNHLTEFCKLEQKAFGILAYSYITIPNTFDTREVLYFTKLNDEVSSVLDANFSEELMVDPNPASAHIHITLPINVHQVLITDLNGKVLYQDHPEQTPDLYINISQFEPGIYTLLLQMKGGSRVSKKFVVNR